MKRLFTALFTIASLVTSSCGESPKEPTVDKPEASSDAVTVIISTSEGDMTLDLNPKAAPISVKNFLSYVDKKYYDNTVFHRVIPGFMIQGGGFVVDDGGLKKKDTEAPIKNESSNGLKNKKGTIAMARTQVMDSATSQFYINVNHNASLDGSYCVFGEITSGYEVAEKIVKQPTHRASLGGQPAGDIPVKAITIKSIRRK